MLVRMTAARVLAMGLTALVGAGCGGSPARLAIWSTAFDTDSLTVAIHNTGEAPTAPLTLSLVGSGVFFIDSDDCSGHVVAPADGCPVRIKFPVSTDDLPEGMLAVDDSHGAHATTTLTATRAVARLAIDNGGIPFVPPTNVKEGETVDVSVRVLNSGTGLSGPVTVDLQGKVVADNCSGVKLGACTFSIEYTAPVGNNAPVTLSGSVHADPGGSAPFTVHFNLIGPLSASGASFDFNAAAGATATVNIHGSGEVPVGPLQLSIEGARGSPSVDYPAFILVAGKDNCSGQTLTAAKDTCDVTVGLDPRLPAGGSYTATLLARAGGETQTVPLSVMRGSP
jgi:hypothetical protein